MNVPTCYLCLHDDPQALTAFILPAEYVDHPPDCRVCTYLRTLYTCVDEVACWERLDTTDNAPPPEAAP